MMENAFYFIFKALFVLKVGHYFIHLNTFMGKCVFLEHMYGWVCAGVTVLSTFMDGCEWV